MYAIESIANIVSGCQLSSGVYSGRLTSICQASAYSWHKAAVQCQKALLSDQASSSRKLHMNRAALYISLKSDTSLFGVLVDPF